MENNDESYILKWMLFESELQHNQEKVECKSTNLRINELKNAILYYETYLTDIQNLNCVWDTDEKKIREQLSCDRSILKTMYNYKQQILTKLRNSSSYGLSNEIVFDCVL